MIAAMRETLLSSLSRADAVLGKEPYKTSMRVRPREFPSPVFLSDTSDCEGHVSTDYWKSEDAIYIHPPYQTEVCSVLREIEIGNLYKVTAAVHAFRADGPVLSLAIGIAAAGVANATNWHDFMGASRHVIPGRWGVVSKTIPSDLMGRRIDVLLSAKVIGCKGNDHAWALFRRFGFEAQEASSA